MFEFEKIIGENVQLISSAPPKRARNVTFLGNFRSNMLLVSLPQVVGGHQRELQVGRRFQIRFKRDNVIYNYRVVIARICNEPYLCLRLPQDKLTREKRLKCDKKEIRVSLLNDRERISVSMVDISICGARLVSAVRLGRVNETFDVNLFSIEGKNSICLPCKIRYVRSENDAGLEGNMQFHHGVEFLHLTPNVENFLLKVAG